MQPSTANRLVIALAEISAVVGNATRLRNAR
jgi:hypothetical protein